MVETVGGMGILQQRTPAAARCAKYGPPGETKVYVWHGNGTPSGSLKGVGGGGGGEVGGKRVMARVEKEC